MLFFMTIFLTIFFFGFIVIVTSIFTYIYSLIYFRILKKSNYFLLVVLNFLIIVSAHLFYSGQITYDFKPTYHTGTFDGYFYFGFILYFCILSSCYIHKLTINKLKAKQQKESN